MKNTFFLLLFLSSLLLAQDLGRSDKKTLEKAVDAVEKAEKSRDSKTFFKELKKVTRHIKRLKKKFPDHPEVKSLLERVIELEKIESLEESRKNVEQALKNVQKIISKVKQGREKNPSKAEKHIQKMQKEIMALERSNNNRFKNTIDNVNRTLSDAKQLGIQVASLEDIEQEVLFDKAIEALNYGQQKNVKNLEKTLHNIAMSNSYHIIEKQKEQAQGYLDALKDVSNNAKVKSLGIKFTELALRIEMYKSFDEIKETLKEISSSINYLGKKIDEIYEFLNKDYSETLFSGNVSSNYNQVLIEIRNSKRDLSATIKELEKKKNVLEQAKKENFAHFPEREQIFERLETMLANWKKAMAHEHKLVKDIDAFIEGHIVQANTEFKNIQKHMANVDKEPKDLLENWYKGNNRVDNIKMFLQGFTGIASITKKSKEMVNLTTQRTKYHEVLNNFRYTKSSAEEGRDVKESLAKSRIIAGNDPSLDKFLKHYETIALKWKKANTEIQSLQNKMWTKIEKASQQVKASGFSSFQKKQKQVPANRLAIIKNLESYKGKAIKDFSREYIRGSGYYGWYLDHGNDRFNYVWDENSKAAIDSLWKKHKEIFEEHKSKIIRQYGLKGEGTVHWNFNGFEDVEFIALVDGTSQYKIKADVRNDRGEIIGSIDKGSIQIVKVRIIALASKYYTYWPGGKNMDSLLDFSNLSR